MIDFVLENNTSFIFVKQSLLWVPTINLLLRTFIALKTVLYLTFLAAKSEYLKKKKKNNYFCGSFWIVVDEEQAYANRKGGRRALLSQRLH